MNALLLHAVLLVPGADPVPAPEDVKAGWVAFAVFLALAVAVALLGISLTRHLRKVRSNAAAGVFGPVEDDQDDQDDHQAGSQPREHA